MNTTIKEIISFVEENDVQFIRLAFCDLNGVQKNISIMPSQLENAFINGISFDASAINGFRDVTNSDLFLKPDPTTMSILPWRPGPGQVVRFFCDIMLSSGEIFSHDGRHILSRVIEKGASRNLRFQIGAECEFYLFKEDDNGNPTNIPLDLGTYMDVFPLDQGENIRRDICLTLTEMGIEPETSHHEQGPGQNEVDFRFSDPLSCGDNIVVFKSVVKTVASRNGVFASFMPKPLIGQPGNGMHVNISVDFEGENIFSKNSKHSIMKEHFIAGVLNHIREITLFLNPSINSYDRFGANEAPKYISWSKENRSQLIRIPAVIGSGGRMELRSPDSTVNPYFAFSLILSAGLEGIEKEMKLTKPVNENLFTVDKSVTAGLDKLPMSMQEAIECASSSSFVETVLGKELVERYITLKQKEVDQYNNSEDKLEFNNRKYFHVF